MSVSLRRNPPLPATVNPPCPVQWCDQGGRHPFDDQSQLLADLGATSVSRLPHSRLCRHETGGHTSASIGAEIYQDSDGVLTTAVVEIGQTPSFELTTPAEVAGYIDAIIRAAALAFPRSGAKCHTYSDQQCAPEGPRAVWGIDLGVRDAR